MEFFFADLDELEAQNIGPDDVGSMAWVESESQRYEAMRSGHGLMCWEARTSASDQFDAGAALGKICAISRVFDFEDDDINVAETSVALDMGDPLPVGAFVLAVVVAVTEFTDGGAGAFTLDVGISGGDDDAYTPNAIDLDAGSATSSQTQCEPAGEVQLAVTITGDVDLGTLTAGAATVTVLYCVPKTTIVEAPEA